MSPLETWSAIASIVTGVAAVGGLALAVWQVNRTHKMTREATATDLFNQSLMMSLQYPELAQPESYEKMNEFDKNRYEWFMSSVLLSSEEILSVTENNKEWRNSIKGNLTGHLEYFATRYDVQYPFRDFYGSELVDLVDEIVANRKVIHA